MIPLDHDWTEEAARYLAAYDRLDRLMPRIAAILGTLAVCLVIFPAIAAAFQQVPA